MIRLGSLCTGYGGLDIGTEAALGPVSLQWVSDPDPGASMILAHRYPDTPNLGDLRTNDWSHTPPVDVLTAGFPCQPVSSAGHQAGINDDRWLFDDICSAIGNMGTRPRLLILENVRGLLTANSGHAMARTIHGLAGLGYVGSWRPLRASDVGAPHRRERIFFVARLADPAHLRRQRAWTPRKRRDGPENSRGIPASHTARNGHGNTRPKSLPRVRPPSVSGDPGVARWGAYTEAITRWEHITGNVVPPWVEPSGPDDTTRLSPAFVEWMMGLSPGWVTDVPGLPRSAQLRALGNGVVWQQAACAITDLLGP